MRNERWRRILNGLFFFLMAALTVTCAIRTAKHDLDFQVFYRVGRQFLDDNFDFYNVARDQNWTYRYGPFFPVMMAPLALLSKAAAQVVWGILNALAFPLAWWFTEKILERRMGSIARHPGARLLTLVMSLDVVTINAMQGNVNVFMFLAIAAGVHLADRKKATWAGVVVGLGTMIKVYPGAAALYFLLTRQYRAFAWSFAWGAAFVFGLPALIYGPVEMVEMIRGWAVVLQDKTYYPFFKYINQAPYSVFWRMTDSQALGQALALAFFAGAAGAAFWLAKKKNDLMVLLSSISLPLFTLTCVFFEYHVITVPIALAVNALLVAGALNPPLKALWAVRFVAVHLMVLAIVGRPLTELIMGYGNYMFGLVAFLVMVAWRRPVSGGVQDSPALAKPASITTA